MASLPSTMIPRVADQLKWRSDNSIEAELMATQAELAAAKQSIATLNAEAEELTEQLHTAKAQTITLLASVREHCQCGIVNHPVCDQAPD